MISNKIFNICNIYIFIWILYLFHWQNLDPLFPGLDMASNGMLGINLIISFYYSIIFWRNYKQIPLFKVINILLVIMVIYGTLSLAGLNLIDTVRQKTTSINPGTYLISVLRTFLPIYTFFIFTKKGYITEKYISRLVWIFLLISIFIFFASKFVLIGSDVDNMEEMRTNNSAYLFVSFFPLVFFLRNQRLLQFVVVAIVLLLTIFGLKRGAIFIVAMATLCYFYHQWKNASISNKLFLLSCIVLLIFVGLTFVEDLVDSSTVVQKRIDQTMEGNTSGRDEIVTNLLDIYFSSNIFNILFGSGADATLFFGLQAHNDWVEILFNQGVIGFSLFFLFWYFIYIIWRHQVIKKGDLAFFLTLWLLCNFLRTFFSMWYSTANLMTTLPLGYLLANIYIRRNKIIRHDETTI